MYCMTACSTHHEGRTSFSSARLQIIRHEGHAITRMEEEDELIFSLNICQQCDEPICASVCPTGSIRRDPLTAAMIIDPKRCVGCRTCLMACYFGAISYSEKKKQVFKCDLCGGDPRCVRFCQPKALTFVPVEQAPMGKRMKACQKMEDSYGYPLRIRRKDALD
jgi:carbon-monoxide dehydrogenase iron sulfur subunit